jgi:hypothetical protein
MTIPLANLSRPESVCSTLANPEPTVRLFRRVLVTYTTGVGGDVAQLGERRTRIAEVVGSNPIVSTTNPPLIDAAFVLSPGDGYLRKAFSSAKSLLKGSGSRETNRGRHTSPWEALIRQSRDDAFRCGRH